LAHITAPSEIIYTDFYIAILCMLGVIMVNLPSLDSYSLNVRG